MDWNYSRQEAKFELAPAGKHRVRIDSVEKAVSKSGRDMLVLKLSVSGSAAKLNHYIVFLNDRPEITNRMLTQFFDSFAGIKDGDLNLQNWIGKTGVAMIEHETNDNGNTFAKIKYFIANDKAKDIPDWVDVDGGIPAITSDDLPF